ncbi:MAG: Sec-independent protein translocase protein TatB [Pseudomonadota bacterium]
MLDIGWPELLVVVAIAVIVVGPKEIPKLVRSLVAITRKIRMISGEMRDSFQEMADLSDIQTLKKDAFDSVVKDVKQETNQIADIHQPIREFKDAVNDLNVKKISKPHSKKIKSSFEPAKKTLNVTTSKAKAKTKTKAKAQKHPSKSNKPKN